MNKEIINNIELYNADCFDVMPTIADKSIDCIIADLPYGTTACKWDSVLPFDKLWEQYKRIIKDNGAIVLFGSQPFTSALIMSNLKMFKYILHWNKAKPSSFFNAKNSPLKKIEDVCIFSYGNIANGAKNLMKYNPQNLKACNVIRPPKNNSVPENRESTISKRPSRNKKYLQEFTNYPSDLIEFSFEGKPIHPTQKPVALFEYLIKTYSNENELILDNTMGSGTTGVACQNTNRKFIGIEKETNYFDIAVKRIKDNNNLFT
jgi:site-specific DNA-methyltransferase (adenine-specific)